MENINNYIAAHLGSQEYRRRLSAASYENQLDWIDYVIGENLIFSHRRTDYTRDNFRDKLHMHDFYEIVIYLRGDIRYVSDCHVLSPQPGDIIVSPPATMHNALLDLPCLYDRCVFYFCPDAFRTGSPDADSETPIHFCHAGPFLRLPPEQRAAMLALLTQITGTLSGGKQNAQLLAYSYIIQLFCLLDASFSPADGACTLPAKVTAIKTYIDENLTRLKNVTEVAEHFYYSREYVSRLFTQNLGIPIGEYITDSRLGLACRLLTEGRSVTEACFEAGFGNVSYFIKTFKEKNGVTPYQYAKKISPPTTPSPASPDSENRRQVKIPSKPSKMS